jgi:hypothetical protein
MDTIRRREEYKSVFLHSLRERRREHAKLSHASRQACFAAARFEAKPITISDGSFGENYTDALLEMADSLYSIGLPPSLTDIISFTIQMLENWRVCEASFVYLESLFNAPGLDAASKNTVTNACPNVFQALLSVVQADPIYIDGMLSTVRTALTLTVMFENVGTARLCYQLCPAMFATLISILEGDLFSSNAGTFMMTVVEFAATSGLPDAYAELFPRLSMYAFMTSESRQLASESLCALARLTVSMRDSMELFSVFKTSPVLLTCVRLVSSEPWASDASCVMSVLYVVTELMNLPQSMNAKAWLISEGVFSIIQYAAQPKVGWAAFQQALWLLATILEDASLECLRIFLGCSDLIGMMRVRIMDDLRTPFLTELGSLAIQCFRSSLPTDRYWSCSVAECREIVKVMASLGILEVISRCKISPDEAAESQRVLAKAVAYVPELASMFPSCH